jgi:hypothetical protein
MTNLEIANIYSQVLKTYKETLFWIEVYEQGLYWVGSTFLLDETFQVYPLSDPPKAFSISADIGQDHSFTIDTMSITEIDPSQEGSLPKGDPS